MTPEKYQHSINPATEETLASFEIETGEAVREKLERADQAYDKWRKEPFASRASRKHDCGNGQTDFGSRGGG
ncbi:MAG: aldehyde dehydrogenase family protein [Acidobacteriota bacterium]